MKYFVTSWIVMGTLLGLPQEPSVQNGSLKSILKDQDLRLFVDNKTIINWKEFSIGKNESVRFHQPESTSIVLNRVLGSNRSEILGLLQANGNVYLINPNGILFGKDSVINVASFLASTFDVKDSDFLNNNELLFKGLSNQSIINYGKIKATDGNVTLIGKIIENHGDIQANEGNVAIGAGLEILLKPENSPLLTIKPTQDIKANITNTGTIEALSIDLQVDDGAYSHGINLSGAVTALKKVSENGRVYLKASKIETTKDHSLKAESGSIEIESSLLVHNGKLDTSGDLGGVISIKSGSVLSSGQILSNGLTSDGGKISIHANNCYTETNGAKLTASGVKKGGEISIRSETSLFTSGVHITDGEMGGEISLSSPTITLIEAKIQSEGTLQGGNILIGGGKNGEVKDHPNANISRLGGNTHISASATQNGNGGEITIWSEEMTYTYGTIEANGGLFGGDGGFIEVSGKNQLACKSHLSANAPFGKKGTVLLDPVNIVINNSTTFPQFSYVNPGIAVSSFGGTILSLSSGNIAITSEFDNTAQVQAGAVYLFNASTGALISTLTGDMVNDRVGSSGLTDLGNGNFVVRSPEWHGTIGAATWYDGTMGLGMSATVSSLNSLTGSTVGDFISEGDVVPLSNANYAVTGPKWTNPMGPVTRAGSVTWCDGTEANPVGAISAANSLIGSTTDDLANVVVTPLSNGNYVVASGNWDNGAATDAGSVTWCDGSTLGPRTVGAISDTNSLVGDQASSFVGISVTELTNGNYVVSSFFWGDGVMTNLGAATWCDGTEANPVGVISVTNSLIGATTDDQVGSTITPLTNGNYVVGSSNWFNPDSMTAFSGAATWGNGSTLGPRTVGIIDNTNSLVGIQDFDLVSSDQILALSNGNYVVFSSSWSSGSFTSNGAVTWGDGASGTVGDVSTTNSLYGSDNDGVGYLGAALTNGNYVTSTPDWTNGGTLTSAGAITWGDGTMATGALVDTTNSIYGSNNFDEVGGIQPLALPNGHYVTYNPNWNGQRGAVTWGDGKMPSAYAISDTNSLVGMNALDQVGVGGGAALSNSNFVANSFLWDGQRGAVTLCKGDGTTVGVVSSTNSLTGPNATDRIGRNNNIAPILVLSDDHYLISSENFDGTKGAATWCDGNDASMPTPVGDVSTLNSILGSTAGDNISSQGFIDLGSGKFLVLSPLWSTNTGAVTPGPIYGEVSSTNSVVGGAAGSGLATNQIMTNSNINLFFSPFQAEGTGVVRAAPISINNIGYSFNWETGTDFTIPSTYLAETLNLGTNVQLKANNDVTISNAITASPGAGNLSISAGKSVSIEANITTGNADLIIVANDLLANGVVDAERSAGDAILSIGNNITIDSGTGSISLSLLNGEGKTNSSSGNLTIGDNVTLTAISAGTISLFAQENNVTFGNEASISSQDGTITITAGKAVTSAFPLTLTTTGSGQLIIISDNLFPTAPLFGTGYISLPMATLSTGGNKLLLYTSQRDLNTMPATINGISYIPGTKYINSTTEKWGTYYPNSSGIPFTIFYKPPNLESLFTSAQYKFMTALIEPFVMWSRHNYGPFCYNPFGLNSPLEFKRGLEDQDDLQSNTIGEK